MSWLCYVTIIFSTVSVNCALSDQKSHPHKPAYGVPLPSQDVEVKRVSPRKEDPPSVNNETCIGGDGSVWVGGLVAILVFYLAVLVVGGIAGWLRRGKGITQEQVMLAGRDIGLGVGVLTMGATWVGGGFINGSAQGTYTRGLVWTQAPFGYALSLVIGGTFFARKMRDAEYVTMIDPFTQKYGKLGALQVLPAAVSEIFWSASILGALGSTLHVILHLDDSVSIVASAVIALLYTLFGGLVSVAYTDVIQIFFIAVGLFVALPFALYDPAVSNIYTDRIYPDDPDSLPSWYGRVSPHEAGEWLDYSLLCLFGGVPWQCYFQRVLSAKSGTRAQLLSYGGAAIALIMTGPAVLFGAIARATAWEDTDYGCPAPQGKTAKLVMPLVLQYLTPPAVAWFGLGAISAAVMSSTDSSLLSASSLLARNFYQKVLRPNCSEREVVYALWGFIVLNCIVSTTLAIKYKSIYELFVLCGDFMYVIVFPQLLLVLYWSPANTYGSVTSFMTSLLLRLLVGDKYLGLPPTFSFGQITAACPDSPDRMCSGDLPFRTFVMLIGLATHLLVSGGTHLLFTRGILPLRLDFLNCYRRAKGGQILQSTTTTMITSCEEITLKSLPESIRTKDFFVY